MGLNITNPILLQIIHSIIGVTPIDLYAPGPSRNVWFERQEFFTSALPSDMIEEEAMFKAALELSRLETEEQNLTKKMWVKKQEVLIMQLKVDVYGLGFFYFTALVSRHS